MFRRSDVSVDGVPTITEVPPVEGACCCAGILATAAGSAIPSVLTLLISMILLKSLLLKVPTVVLLGISAKCSDVADVPAVAGVSPVEGVRCCAGVLAFAGGLCYC